MSDTVEHEAFMKMFEDFFRNAQMVSSYKAVFLKSLADIGDYGKDDLVGKDWICPQGDKIRLDLNFIAIRFAKYYWDMEVAFKMRHIPKYMANQQRPEDDVHMVKLVKEKAAETARKKIIEATQALSYETLNDLDSLHEIQKQALQNPPTIQQLASDDMKEFREDVIKRGIKPEVLVKLLHDMPKLYERVHGTNYIELDSSIIEFMKKFSHVIKKALNYMLAAHLEKINPEARHIAIKINNDVEFTSRLNTVRGLEIKIDVDSFKPGKRSE